MNLLPSCVRLNIHIQYKFLQAKKNKSVQPKKGKKTMQEKDNEEENNGGNKQSCSSLSSEDDSNASQELNEEIENSNAKTKASRGSATDPQSLYARVSWK